MNYNNTIIEFFKKFNIGVIIEGILAGSVVETYELKLLTNTLISKIKNLEENLTLELGKPIRIIAPLPNKTTIGIEIPLENRKIINFEKYVQTLKKSNMYLPFILGEDAYGNARIEDLATFPHLLIAGSTGTGKSNIINSIITSLLIFKKFGEVEFVLIDPKRVELNSYNGLFNLGFENKNGLKVPKSVITDSVETVNALNVAIIEMENRYKILQKHNIKDMRNFPRINNTQYPPIIIVIDELADLMLSKEAKEIEIKLQKIAQLGRAASIHLIVATQRPTVNIITGKIKTNLTTRISLKMTQSIDSKTILNCTGAENLLGKGDMLFQKNNIERLHGVLINDFIITSVINDIKKSSEHFNKMFSGFKLTPEFIKAYELSEVQIKKIQNASCL